MSGLSLPSPPDRLERARPVLHRSAWLVPVTDAPMENGAVLVRNGVILSAGPYELLKSGSPPSVEEVDHGTAALIPALVNAHTHLELSTLGGRISLPQESFASWLRQLLPLRLQLSPEMQRRGVSEGIRRVVDAGVALCGDIANGLSLLEPEETPLIRKVFLEVLGFDRDGLESALGPEEFEAFQRGARSNAELSFAAHACYSASERVVREAKEWCRSRGHVFSIHAAEHEHEIEFLETGTGYCRQLLEELGRWVPQWTPPRTTPVGYLERLGVLDERTLLVHAVHMSPSDWQAVVRNRCPVCFCPRSNANLNVGYPDVERAIRSGVTVALGTDSLASNSDLSLFAEAVEVLDKYNSLSPEEVLYMITMGGASALRQDRRFGSIEEGKSSDMLAVSLPEYLPASELFEAVLHQGAKGAWQWVK